MASIMDLITGAEPPKASDLAGNWWPATNTVNSKLRREYNFANAETGIGWEQFIAEKGYKLDPQGNVLIPKEAAPKK